MHGKTETVYAHVGQKVGLIADQSEPSPREKILVPTFGLHDLVHKYLPTESASKRACSDVALSFPSMEI